MKLRLPSAGSPASNGRALNLPPSESDDGLRIGSGEPSSRVTPSLDGARHTSGLTSRLILNYVEREGGPRAVQLVLEQCQLSDQEHTLRNPASWFDFWTKLALFEAAGAVLERADVARRIGQSAVELQSLSGLKIALRAFGSPSLTYGAVPGVTGRFTRAHRLDVLELGDDHARFRYVDISGVGYHLADCQYTAGLLACIPTMFGVLPARVKHAACGVRGAPECVYELEWDPYRSPLTRGARGLARVAKSFRRVGTSPRAFAAHRERRRALEQSVRDQEEAAER